MLNNPSFNPHIYVRFKSRLREEMQRNAEHKGTSFCFGINARVTYMPFAVNKKKFHFQEVFGTQQLE